MEQSNTSETEQHVIDKTCEKFENKATEWTRTLQTYRLELMLTTIYQ